jgi:8-oxo-dGTP diphosphatase
MTEMTLQELTQLMDDFVRAKGWYNLDSPRQQTPRNIAISLSLECAEVLEHFQWSDKTNNSMELSGELADIALYLLQLARLTNTNLEQAIKNKLAVNYSRRWDQE